MKKAFLEWKDSDNVILTDEGYRTQCMQYAKAFSLKGLYRYFINEYGDFYLN